MTELTAIFHKVSNKILGDTDIIDNTLLENFGIGTELQADFDKCFNANRRIKINCGASGFNAYAECLSSIKANQNELQADFDTFDCMVRDRFSRNASTNSPTGISKAIANLSRVSNSGICLWLNQTDQFGGSTFVRRFKSLYDSFKNSSLVSGLSLQAYINFTILSSRVILSNNRLKLFTRIAQITKPLFPQELRYKPYPGKDGFSINFWGYEQQYTRPRGRSPSPSFTMPSYIYMGGIA